MDKKIKVGLQYWIPKHALTRLVGKLASAEAGGLTTAVIPGLSNNTMSIWMRQSTQILNTSKPSMNFLFVS